MDQARRDKEHRAYTAYMAMANEHREAIAEAREVIVSLRKDAHLPLLDRRPIAFCSVEIAEALVAIDDAMRAAITEDR